MRPRHTAIEEFEAAIDLLPVRERCLWCDWSWDGMAGEGRTEAIRHRLSAHPEVQPSVRKHGRNLRSFRQPKLHKEQWNEIYAERERRARLMGVDLSDSAA